MKRLKIHKVDVGCLEQWALWWCSSVTPPGEEVRWTRGGRLESGSDSVHAGQWIAALRRTEPQGWTIVDKFCGIKKHQKSSVLTLHYAWCVQELRERVLRGKYRIPFYMSTDCENLLKKLLVLNPGKRGSLQVKPASQEVKPAVCKLHASTAQKRKVNFKWDASLARFPSEDASLRVYIISKSTRRSKWDFICIYILDVTSWLPSTAWQHFCLFDSQQIMKDRWMNAGYDEDHLKPYIEPEQDFNDLKRIGQINSIFLFIFILFIYLFVCLVSEVWIM